MATKSSASRDPRTTEALLALRAAWVPMFLARAAQGFASVLLVTSDEAGATTLALLAPAEASALLKRLGDPRGAAKVVGTATPGSTWCLARSGAEHAVYALALAPFFAPGA